MRSNSLLFSRFWIAGTGKKILLELGADHAVVAIYLFTGPHAHMSGLYWCPEHLIATETNTPPRELDGILARLAGLDFLRYDEPHEMMWIISICRLQIGEELNEKDNRVRSVIRHLKALPGSYLIEHFCTYYGLEIEAPSKGLRSPRIPSCPLPVPSPSSAVHPRPPSGEKQ